MCHIIYILCIYKGIIVALHPCLEIYHSLCSCFYCPLVNVLVGSKLPAVPMLVILGFNLWANFWLVNFYIFLFCLKIIIKMLLFVKKAINCCLISRKLTSLSFFLASSLVASCDLLERYYMTRSYINGPYHNWGNCCVTYYNISFSCSQHERCYLQLLWCSTIVYTS